jgi:hypothetical protein
LLRSAKLGAHERADRFEFTLVDGSSASIALPRQGILPHDLAHDVIERSVPDLDGLLTLVARGADPGCTQTLNELWRAVPAGGFLPLAWP